MLDARCLMLDNLHIIDNGVDNHPVSSNQYQGSAGNSKVFLETASANCHCQCNYKFYCFVAWFLRQDSSLSSM